MHQQFLPAIGVMTALKLNRIHYLRPRRQEAAQAKRKPQPAEIDRNHFTPKSPQWYQRHAHEGYGGLKQFQNGYDSHAP